MKMFFAYFFHWIRPAKVGRVIVRVGLLANLLLLLTSIRIQRCVRDVVRAIDGQLEREIC